MTLRCRPDALLRTPTTTARAGAGKHTFMRLFAGEGNRHCPARADSGLHLFGFGRAVQQLRRTEALAGGADARPNLAVTTVAIGGDPGQQQVPAGVAGRGSPSLQTPSRLLGSGRPNTPLVEPNATDTALVLRPVGLRISCAT